MLKCVWVARHSRAPATTDWQNAVDGLYRVGDTAAVQTFPRAGFAINAAKPPLSPANPALTEMAGAWVKGLDGRAAVVMVHGFDFDPTPDELGDPEDDPYKLVFGPPSEPESWLTMVDADGSGDRCVAFAWVSKGSFVKFGNAGWSNRYQYPALDLAPLAARALATVIAALQDAGATVDLLAHSLGTRTSLQALRILAADGRADSVRRAVFMGGAQFCCDADAIMAMTRCQVFNLVNRRDDVLTRGGEPMCHPYRETGSASSKVIGLQGLPNHGPRWIDIQLDSAAARQELAARGYEVSPEPVGGRGAHWGYYRHPGNRALIGDLLGGKMLTAEWFAGIPTTVVPCDYVPPCPVPATPLDAATRIALNTPALA